MVIPAFCTINDAKTLTPIVQGFSEFDATINSLIGVATQSIMDAARRNFVKKQRFEYFMTPDSGDCRQDYKLFVAEWPVDPTPELLIVEYNPYMNTGEITPLVAGTDYELEPDSGAVHLYTPTVYSKRSVKVTYTGGYIQASNGLIAVPENLRMACAMQVSIWAQRVNAQQLGKLAETKEGTSSSRFIEASTKGLATEVLGIIRGYRRQLVGTV